MTHEKEINTYKLLRLDEVALAGYFDLEDTRFDEWYAKNQAVGDKLYQALLDKKIDLVAFCMYEGKHFYSILTRSPKQEGALQLTNIDRRGPISHSRLTNPKMLDLPGYGATIAAVPDITKCNEPDILQIIGFEPRKKIGLKDKASIVRESCKELEGVSRKEITLSDRCENTDRCERR